MAALCVVWAGARLSPLWQQLAAYMAVASGSNQWNRLQQTSAPLTPFVSKQHLGM